MHNIKIYWHKLGWRAVGFSAGLTALFTAGFARADNNIQTAPTNIITTPSEVVALLCTIFNWMFWFLIVISSIMVLVAGYTYATSNGDSEKVQKATKTITYAALGVVAALLAKVFPEIVGSLFGLTVNVCAVSSSSISF